MSECLSIVTRTQTGEVYQVHRVDVECKLSTVSRETASPFILHLIQNTTAILFVGVLDRSFCHCSFYQFLSIRVLLSGCCTAASLVLFTLHSRYILGPNKRLNTRLCKSRSLVVFKGLPVFQGFIIELMICHRLTGYTVTKSI